MIQVVNSKILIENTRFADNLLTSGTNGIMAINSKLTLDSLQVYISQDITKEAIKAEVGFLSLYEGSEVNITLSRF